MPVTVQYAADLTDHVRLAPVSNPTQVMDSALIVGTQDLATATLTTPAAAGLLKVALYHMTEPPAWRVDGPQVQHYPYKIALARSGEVAVSGVPLSVQTAAVITAEVAAEGHTAGDRLALYEVSASDVGLGLQNRPLSGPPTSTYNGEPTYQVTFTVTQPGQYEVRFFDGLTLARLQKSALITVSGEPVGGPTSTGTLTINGQGAGELLVITAAGTALTAEVSGTAARTGEVQVYRASNQQLVQRVPVNGASVVSLQPIEVAGDYWTQWVPTAELTFLGPALRRNQTAVGVMTFYDTDVIGSVRRITNASGAVVEEHDYQPFGREYPPPATGAVPAQPLQFAGKEYDAQTELNYFGARYYQAGTGRFNSIDPIFAREASLADPQRWNRYAYVRNSPFRHVDPDGRCIDGCVGELVVLTVASIATSVIGYVGGELITSAQTGEAPNITPKGVEAAVATGAVSGALGGFATGLAVLNGFKVGIAATTTIATGANVAGGLIVAKGTNQPMARAAAKDGTTAALASVVSHGLEGNGRVTGKAKIGIGVGSGAAAEMVTTAASAYLRRQRPALPPLPSRPPEFEKPGEVNTAP